MLLQIMKSKYDRIEYITNIVVVFFLNEMDRKSTAGSRKKKKTFLALIYLFLYYGFRTTKGDAVLQYHH